MLLILVIAGLVIDVGLLYRERAAMQAACDGAALAGAEQIADHQVAEEAAREVLAANGYVAGQNGVVEVVCQPNPDGEHPGRYLVRLTREMPAYFGRVVGFRRSPITTFAVAVFTAAAPINISGGGTYGVEGIQNLSLFGPFAYYSYGDCYSTKYLDDGSVNPEYQPHGYDFAIYVPRDEHYGHGGVAYQFQRFGDGRYRFRLRPGPGRGE